MIYMTAIFNSSGLFSSILFWTAIVFTLIFLVQTILLLIGGDHDSDFDHSPDFQSDNIQHDVGISFQFLTIRNLITFVMFFSWGTLWLMSAFSFGWAVFIGFIFGCMTTMLVALLFYLTSKLQTNNVPTLDGITGRLATVYLRIPAGGVGKITVELNGALSTIDATSKVELHTGTICRVVGISDNTLPEVISEDIYTSIEKF